MLGFWYNGNAITKDTIDLSITDPGLLYGATVFTTMRVYQFLDHSLTQWAGHCDRIKTSLDTFGWQQPDWSQLRHGADWMTQHYPVLRIAVFPDGREWITGRALPEDLTQRQTAGIAAWVAGGLARSLPSHKTGNYLAPWLALQAAQRMNAQEAILTNSAGDWLETSTGNLWGWKEGHWWTPPLESEILPGLLRSRLISWLKWHNEEVTEAPWNAALVEHFDAIAYTNCVVEVIPIHTVLNTGTTLSYAPTHPGIQTLRDLFFEEGN
ncbi:aminotransferase class IV [Myxacorys almedinensis]|uniref:4-amino-4-deoxychorismate lyase n=1 Tax=Myxacorys almedinensis A TaxID=2690445 RepID=A0A8J7YZT4_9CYAN|nr:aminotransferase class IV [Myxacorys almedinensis]NDJ17094.1 4-amino-4-deoxychorismate lyase [Myxacorys almedinensis A]